MTEPTIRVALPARLQGDFENWLRRYGLQAVTVIDRVENIRAVPAFAVGIFHVAGDVVEKHLETRPLTAEPERSEQ